MDALFPKKGKYWSRIWRELELNNIGSPGRVNRRSISKIAEEWIDPEISLETNKYSIIWQSLS